MPNVVKKIAVFMPRATPFYVSLLFYIKRGFEEIGINVFGGTELLEENVLLEFCRQYRPDAVFEMNRSRNEIPNLSKEILHIAWIVDTNGRKINSFQNSEITYLFSRGGIEAYRSKGNGIVGWLPPGACPKTYSPLAETNYLSDFSFVGHMCFPWSQKEKERLIDKSHTASLCFGDILEPYTKKVLENETIVLQSEEDCLNIALEIIREKTNKKVTLDLTMEYDLKSRFFRMLFRKQFLDMALQQSKSVRFFGTGGWQKWPQFSPFFQKFLPDPNDVHSVYQTTRINLHHGSGIHFRVVDCMASEGFLFYLEPPQDDRYGGIQTLFEPYVHYVPVSEENFEEKAVYYLENIQERQEIARNASIEVLNNHTWKHRALKILNDIRKI